PDLPSVRMASKLAMRTKNCPMGQKLATGQDDGLLTPQHTRIGEPMASDRLTSSSSRVGAASPAEAATPPQPRLYYLDHLRVALTVLVVLHHVAIAYANISDWYYDDPADDPTSTL